MIEWHKYTTGMSHELFDENQDVVLRAKIEPDKEGNLNILISDANTQEGREVVVEPDQIEWFIQSLGGLQSMIASDAP